jgi:hypothetical protein
MQFKLSDEHNALQRNFAALVIHQDAKTRAQMYAQLQSKQAFGQPSTGN